MLKGPMEEVVIFVASRMHNPKELNYVDLLLAEMQNHTMKPGTTCWLYTRSHWIFNDIKQLGVQRADEEGMCPPVKITKDGLTSTVSVTCKVHLIGLGESSYIGMDELYAHLSKTHETKRYYFINESLSAGKLTYIAQRGVLISSNIDVPYVETQVTPKLEYIAVNEAPFQGYPETHKILFEEYKRTEEGTRMGQLADTGKFAVVILNDHHESLDKKLVFYDDKTAYNHGHALGDTLPAGTNLIIFRNQASSAGYKFGLGSSSARDRFIQGYKKAQLSKEQDKNATILCFSPSDDCSKIDFNLIGCALSEYKNCIAFVADSSDAKGMRQAAYYVDNQRVSLMALVVEEQLDSKHKERATPTYSDFAGYTVITLKKDGAVSHERTQNLPKGDDFRENPYCTVLRRLNIVRLAKSVRWLGDEGSVSIPAGFDENLGSDVFVDVDAAHSEPDLTVPVPIISFTDGNRRERGSIKVDIADEPVAIPTFSWV